MSKLTPVNYKEYPEYMFAMITAFLPSNEGDDLRKVAGSVGFSSRDKDGNTYRNGLLHSYDDKHAITNSDGSKEWWLEGRFVKMNDSDDSSDYNC